MIHPIYEPLKYCKLRYSMRCTFKLLIFFCSSSKSKISSRGISKGGLRYVFPLEKIFIFITQKGGSRTPGTLPWLRPCSRRVENTHSTERALFKVQNDIILSMDRQEVALLVLIDLSAATERGILLQTLEKDFGDIGDTQKWLASCLSHRKQGILMKICISDAFIFGTRVPQGGCLDRFYS